MICFKQKYGLLVICLVFMLLCFSIPANADRPLVLIPSSTPQLDFTIDRGCPSKEDYINLNISTVRGTGDNTSFAFPKRGAGSNVVDLYAVLLRPDGHFFSLNNLSQTDTLSPIISSWDVVTADNLTASFPMSQLPINEAGFYSLYIAFFEPQGKNSAGRPLVPLTPIAAAYDKFYTDPQLPYYPPEPGTWNLPSKCICNSGMWELIYHATTTIDIGTYKLTAVWDGTFELNATADKSRPLVPLKSKKVTGSGALTLKETAELPSLGCSGTVNTSAQVTVDGSGSDKFYLTINSPSINTSITMTCTNTTPPATIVMPFTIPAYSSNVTIPAVDGTELDMTQEIPISSGRPVILITGSSSTTSVSSPSIKLGGNFKLRCKG